MTRLVNDKRIDWDEHLSIILFSYRTVYKVAIGYTPYQLVYGLHPLMPTKYVLLAINIDHKHAEPTRVLITRIIGLERLPENKLEAQNNVGANRWSKFLWSQQKNTKKKFQFGDMSYGFPREKQHIWANSRKMVWSIQGRKLLTQKYCSYLC